VQPGAVGVPSMEIVDVSLPGVSANPGGNEPAETCHAYGGTPPVALNPVPPRIPNVPTCNAPCATPFTCDAVGKITVPGLGQHVV